MTRPAYFALHLVPATLLVGSLAPWAYGYFVFLRVVVCVATGWLAVLDYQRDNRTSAWSVLLGLAAVLFNPIVPIYLDRQVWTPIDLGVAALLFVHLLMTAKSTDTVPHR